MQTPWLMLVHHLPAEPAYLRVKVWRRLQTLGAVALKGSVYVLPGGDKAREQFSGLLKAIEDGGGGGFVAEARFVEGLSDVDIEAAFRQARTADYADLARDLLAIIEDDPAKLAQARRRFGRIAGADHFGALGREEVELSLAEAEARAKQRGPAQVRVPRSFVLK
jgi:hypothetical protein